ncbi:MAG TPA: hypothetical protein VHH14_01190, partial [Solirubrobacterales bacterium]|nr:hypothetical protein [Solirubrobacterales bacterium]
MAREDLERLAHLAESLARASGEDAASRVAELRERLGDELALIEGRAEEADRRRGTLAAAVGRGEAKVRALQELAPGGDGIRLYEVIRARPGYEAAVEAALGEFGAGVLAQNVDEGLRLLSGNERVAVRLDAGRVEEGGAPPGKPLAECVEVLDRRYAQAVERLLGGIYVIDEPQKGAPSNGYVAVTRQGLRLTRTSLSRRPASGGFAREAMLDAERGRLEALKKGPGGTLYDLRERISAASRRIERLATTSQGLSTLADRASRARVAGQPGADARGPVGQGRKALGSRREPLDAPGGGRDPLPQVEEYLPRTFLERLQAPEFAVAHGLAGEAARRGPAAEAGAREAQALPRDRDVTVRRRALLRLVYHVDAAEKALHRLRVAPVQDIHALDQGLARPGAALLHPPGVQSDGHALVAGEQPQALVHVLRQDTRAELANGGLNRSFVTEVALDVVIHLPVELIWRERPEGDAQGTQRLPGEPLVDDPDLLAALV